MSIVSLRDLPAQAASFFDDGEDRRFGDLSDYVLSILKWTLEESFDHEVRSRIGCSSYERSPGRQDYRNGFRYRTIATRFGALEKVKIPRIRTENYLPSILSKHRQALPDVEELVGKSLLCGGTRKDVCEILNLVFGYPPAQSLIARVEVYLDAEAKRFKNRPLLADYLYLFLDGAKVTIKEGLRSKTRMVLTAIGITHDGRKEVLGFERARTESTEAWRGFLSRLVARGLNPSRLELIISDEAAGILAAVSEVLGDVPHQLCWAHRMRNAYETASKEHSKAIVADLRKVYRANSHREARIAFLVFKEHWRSIYPRLVATVEEDLGTLLAFFNCPREHWRYIRTTNPIERIFRDLRRRSFGWAGFANPKSCDRLLFGVFWQANQRWANNPVIESTHKR
jgi:transposase-like protein